MLNLTTAPSQIKTNTTLVFADGLGFVGEVQPIGSLFRAVDFAGNVLTPPRSHQQALAYFRSCQLVAA